MNFSPVRLYQWGAIALVIVLGAGLYWKHQGQNESKAGTTISAPETSNTRASTGLASHWTFDREHISGTSITDRVGTNTGTSSGTPAAAIGKFGQGLDFDASDDHVNVTSAASLDIDATEDFSIAGWFNRDTFANDHTIVGKRSGQADTDDGYIVYIDDTTDQLIFEVSDTGDTDEYSVASTATFTATGWHHFVVVWDQDSATGTEIFIDGAGSGTDTGTITNVGDLTEAVDFRIGSESDGGNRFDGKLDDIRFYSTALSASEAYQLATSGMATVNTPVEDSLSQGLLGYWKMDEGTGTSTTADASGNANNLTMSGMESGDWVAGQIGPYALDFDGVAPSGGVSYLGYAEVADSDGNQSQSITVPANTDFALAFISGWRSGSNPTVTSISLGGTAMTSVGSSVSDADGAAYMYYVNTSSGSKTFASVQSNSWTEGGKAVLLFFSGVDQSAPIRSSSALNAANDATLSFSGLTSQSGDTSVLQMAGYSGTNVDVDLSSQTKIFENTSAFNSNYNAAAYKAASGSTVDLSCYGNYPNSVVAVLVPATALTPSEYLTVADPSSGILDFVEGKDFTLTGWFNRDTSDTDDTLIAKRAGLTSSNAGYSLQIPASGDLLTFEVSDGDGANEYSRASSTAFTTTGWHQFAAVWENDLGIRLYVDGAENQGSASGTLANIGDIANGEAFRIGVLSDASTTSPFDGKLDDIRVYGYPLSGSEVLKLYQTTAPAQPVDTSLVGHWTFDGPDVKGSTVIDRSGKGNDGTITGAVPAIGKLGQGLSFNGTGDYVNLGATPSSLDFTGHEASFFAWIKLNNSGAESPIFSEDSGCCYFERFRYTSDGNLELHWSSSAYTSNKPPLSSPLNQWHFVGGVRSGSTGNWTNIVYIDGVPAKTVSNITVDPVGGPTAYIGYSAESSRYFHGTLDDVRVYNRALSASEVASLYNLGK